jgi:hypothetical protein
MRERPRAAACPGPAEREFFFDQRKPFSQAKTRLKRKIARLISTARPLAMAQYRLKDGSRFSAT